MLFIFLLAATKPVIKKHLTPSLNIYFILFIIKLIKYTIKLPMGQKATT